ncbi:collagenase-like [Anticarsia gemmatalis]|uniref:collagenase-like n=1 Tax=Anticarsia gemmatalis TaxID=129554 RepID=UPI003F75A7C3
MAAGYLLGLLFVLCFVQGEFIKNEPKTIEELRSSEPNWYGTRVVSGWPAEEGQFPYQVSLRMVASGGTVFPCGGSVIHNKWILSAAHCLANCITFVVRLGLINLTRPEYIVETTHKYIHPNYDEITAGVQTDDIALLRLEQYIPYSANIQPSRLQSSAQKNIDYTGVTMVVSGFGRTNDPWLGGAASESLLWVFQRGVAIEECRQFYEPRNVIQEQTLCAGYYNVSSQSACQGDSGGPLTIEDKDGQRTQVGVVSFGHIAGCSSSIPSGYVRPGHYHDWYVEVTGINFDWDSSFPDPESEESSEPSESSESSNPSESDESNEPSEPSEEDSPDASDEADDEDIRVHIVK